jgi:hypothetical protein
MTILKNDKMAQDHLLTGNYHKNESNATPLRQIFLVFNMADMYFS